MTEEDNFSIFKEEMTASEMLPINHKEFAQYAIREFITNAVDGLKLVYRRILWILATNTRKQKAAELIAATMGGLHPHGDQSIYKGLVRLAQSFTQCMPLITPLGNVGSVGGGRAAAPRYLDITRSEFTYDLFFNHVDTRTLSMVDNELNTGKEPTYFIPVIPTVFIVGGIQIGVGFKSQIPFYDFTSVCDLAIKYILMRQDPNFHPENHYPELAKYFVPDFPIYTLIRNMDNVQEAYSKGDFSASIVMDGTMDVFPDKVHLRTVPYGIDFKGVIEKIRSEMIRPSFLSANINEVSNLMAAVDVGDIKMTLKRGVDVFEILDELKRQLGFTKSYAPIWNFSDEKGTVYNLTPYQLLEKWYIERSRSVHGALNFVQRDLNTKLREIEAKVIIVDHTDEVMTIIKTSSCSLEAVERLVKRFQKERLSERQAEYILSLNLSQLTRQGKDKLLEDLETVTKQMHEHTEKFAHVDDIIIEEITRVRDKYRDKIPKRCLIPDYIGCIHVHPNGIIQVRSLHELIHLVKRWGSEDVSIEMYPSGKSSHIKIIDGRPVPDDVLCYPKVFKAHDFRTFKWKPRWTIVLNDGLVFRTDGIQVPPKGQMAICGDEFTAVTKKNVVLRCKATDIPKRNQVTATGVQTDLVYVSSTVSDDLVVLYHENGVQNTVVLERVKPGDALRVPVVAKASVLAIFREQDPIAFTLDSSLLNHCTLRHLYFRDAETLMGSERKVTIYLNRRTTSNNKAIIPIIKGDDVYGIQTLKRDPDGYEFL